MRRLLPLMAIAAAAAGLIGVASGQNADTKIYVGILHSLSGNLAISESALKDAELLAIEEINKAGGVLGKTIEPIVEDGESQFNTTFPEKAKKLVLRDKVAVLFGCWTTVSRKNVLPVIEEHNGLLFYPAAYEGNECSKNIVYVAATPNQQIVPALDWITSKTGANRNKIFFVGTDFILPRTANLIARKHLKSLGIEPAGEEYVPFGQREYADIARQIQQSKADAIVSEIIGDSNINFYAEMATQGITPDKCPIFATFVGEDELRGLFPEQVKGHYATASYFEALDTPRNHEFVKRFRAKYGQDRAVFDGIASAYSAVHLWKLAAEKAKSFDVDRVRAAISQVEFDSPEGMLRVSPKTLHVNKSLFVGRIRGNRQTDVERQFEIVHKTGPIEAEPYPQVAFPGWGCDWTKRGLVRGVPVDVRR
jgi:urea transport system substrate-binding protein